MKFRRIRPRLAPMLLATLLLAILIRGGAAWHGFATLIHGNLVAEAEASESKPDESQPHETESAGDGPPAEHKSGATRKSRPQPACEPAPPSGPIFSETEIAVLQQLAQRREALDRREQDLERRQMLVAAVENRIAARLAEMEKLQAVLESAIQRNDAEMEARIRSLVKIYELMKPADAARIFEALDMETLLPVAERMNERRLAPVMAQMNPANARDITERLKKLRELTARPLP